VAIYRIRQAFGRKATSPRSFDSQRDAGDWWLSEFDPWQALGCSQLVLERWESNKHWIIVARHSFAD
jgi:hypothetical protein